MKRITPSILLLITCFLVSCQTGYIDKKVKYQYVIEPPHIPILKGVTVRNVYIKAVKLTFEKREYPDNIPKQPVLKPSSFEQDLRYILKLQGIETVESPDKSNATIEADLTLEALPETYRHFKNLAGSPSDKCYTSAGAYGTLTITLPGKNPIQIKIKGRILTPRIISECTLPSKAPFREAWLKGLLRGFVHLWGPLILVKAAADADCIAGEMATISADWTFEPFRSVKMNRDTISFLIRALNTRNRCTQMNILKLFGHFGKPAKPAIPAIIALFNNDKPYLNDKAMDALKLITGRKFSKTGEWRKWWESAKTDPEYKDL